MFELFTVLAIKIELFSTFACMFVSGYRIPFLLGEYVGLEWPSHMGGMCLIF